LQGRAEYTPVFLHIALAAIAAVMFTFLLH
jgi:hypothetical protein